MIGFVVGFICGGCVLTAVVLVIAATMLSSQISQEQESAGVVTPVSVGIQHILAQVRGRWE